MKKTSMFLVVLLAFLLAAGSLGPFAQASDYPTKPITITCVWGAGGGTDVALRAFAKYLEKEIGQPIVVVNKPGGAGAIGYTEVARQRGDGYNLVQCTVDFAVMEALGTHAFSDKFRFIGLVNKYPMLIPVNAKAKWNTIKELIEDAKQRPGEITCGVTGAGNINHAAGLIFEKACGVKFNSLPFSQGDAEARAALLGGHVDLLTSTSSSVMPYVLDGSIRVLAVMDNERAPELPDVPTFQELGYDAVVGMWRGILAPKDTPDEIIEKIEAAMKKAFDNPEYVKWAMDTGVGHYWMPGDEFEPFVKSEIAKLREALKDIKF